MDKMTPIHVSAEAELMGFSLHELRERTRIAREHQEHRALEYIKKHVVPMVETAADQGSNTVYYALHDVYTSYQRTFIHNGLIKLGFTVARDDINGIERLLISW